MSQRRSQMFLIEKRMIWAAIHIDFMALYTYCIIAIYWFVLLFRRNIWQKNSRKRNITFSSYIFLWTGLISKAKWCRCVCVCVGRLFSVVFIIIASDFSWQQHFEIIFYTWIVHTHPYTHTHTLLDVGVSSGTADLIADQWFGLIKFLV